METSENYSHPIYKFCEEKDADAVGWAFVNKDKAVLFPFQFPPLAPGEIRVNVISAGICHSDVLHVRSSWGPVLYPVVPGHEIVGEVAQIGEDVKKFKIGDKVALGAQRQCCNSCKFCIRRRQILCTQFSTSEKSTYSLYFGGLATAVQHPETMFHKLEDGMKLLYTGPLMCAGSTVWAPIVRYAKRGDKIGVIGIGGLGHLAVKFLVKLGHEVTAFTSSYDKVDFIKALGATEVVNYMDEEEYKKHVGKYDFILNTVPGGKEALMYTKFCGPDGNFLQVGVPNVEDNLSIPTMHLVANEIKIIGSALASLEEEKDMLDMCCKEDVYPLCEEYSFEDFPKAFDKLENGKPIFRCVLNVEEYSKKNNLWK